MSDGWRIYARGGGGCVMGSKNLKAIAVQGNKGIKIADPQGLLRWADGFRKKIDSNEAGYGFKRRGTLGAIEMYQRIGGNFWRNNQGTLFRGDEVQSDKWVKKFHKYSEVCSSDCFVACDGRYKIEGHESPRAQHMWAKNSAIPNTSRPVAVPVRWTYAIGRTLPTGEKSPTITRWIIKI